MRIMTFILCTVFMTAAPIFSQTVTTWTDGTPDDAIAIDSNDSVFASNFNADSVFRFDENGNGTAYVTGLNSANGLAFDSDDNLYICDWGANKILRYDNTGAYDTEQFITGNPSGIIKAWNNDDMIYTRYSGNTINRITPNGVITQVSADPALNGPVGLAYDDDGNLYVGNYNNREVFRVLNDGTLQYVATVGDTGNLGFIAFGRGLLWGTAFTEHRIYTINQNEIDEVTLFAGSSVGNDDGDISNATFNRPNGILFSRDENTLYITDFGSKNIRLISFILSVDDLQLNKNDVRLFPNPSETRFTIQATTNGTAPYKVTITDVLGKVIFSSEGDSQGTLISETIDVSPWSQGIYLVKISSGNSAITKKFVR